MREPTDMEMMVARAIADDFGLPYNSVPDDKQDWLVWWQKGRQTDVDVNGPFKCDYRNMARAAIRAMREPSPFMVDAAIDAEIRLTGTVMMGTTQLGGLSNKQLGIFQAMIDAASPPE